MNRKIAPFIDIVRMEDKETKLKAFIRTVVEQSKDDAASQGNDEAILLIARSAESPVAKAVASLVRDGTIVSPVKVVLALVPRETANQAICDTISTLVSSHGGRVVRDARVFDAHEQLVLGPAASWVGDCMRRDPMKRDAYECFAADCAKTAGWARTSHERLWAICELMPDVAFVPAVEPVPAEVAAAATANTDSDGANDPIGGSST